MNDYQEQQPASEKPGRGYVSLVHVDDNPEVEADSEFEEITYPEIQISNIGLVKIVLSKNQLGSEELLDNHPHNAIVLDKDGEKETTELEATREGNYLFRVEIDSPHVRRRGLNGRVYLSLDGIEDHYYSELYNESEDDENVEKYLGELKGEERISEVEGTHITVWNWKNINDSSTGWGPSLMMRNDPQFLSSLNFRFEFIQPGGGDVN